MDPIDSDRDALRVLAVHSLVTADLWTMVYWCTYTYNEMNNDIISWNAKITSLRYKRQCSLTRYLLSYYDRKYYKDKVVKI